MKELKNSSIGKERSNSRSRQGKFDRNMQRSRSRQDLRKDFRRSMSIPSARSISRGTPSEEFNHCIEYKCKKCRKIQDSIKLLLKTVCKDKKKEKPLKDGSWMF